MAFVPFTIMEPELEDRVNEATPVVYCGIVLSIEKGMRAGAVPE
jgi:hypothetical protein